MLKRTDKKGYTQAFKIVLGKLICDKPTSRSKTGVRGVYRTGAPGYYQARITIGGKEEILYCGKNFNKACKIRKEAEQKYYTPIINEAIKNGYLEVV